MIKIKNFIYGVLPILITGMIFTGCSKEISQNKEANVKNDTVNVEETTKENNFTENIEKIAKENNFTEKYEDGKGMSFSYPSTWTQSDKIDGVALFYLDDLGTNVNIVTAPAPAIGIKDGDDKKTLEETINSIKEIYEVKEVETDKIEINDYTVNLFDAKINTSGVDLNTIQYQIFENDTFYAITLTSNIIDGEVDEDIVKEFKAVMKTLEFSK